MRLTPSLVALLSSRSFSFQLSLWVNVPLVTWLKCEAARYLELQVV